MHVQLNVGDLDRDLVDRLDDEIYAFNAATTGMRDGRLLSIRATDDGELAGGLSGWTWGGCGYVHLLWVAQDRRGQGVGTALLTAAEKEMVARDCRVVLLATHSFQAPSFYRRHGYTQVAEVADYPVGYSQVHFRKDLPPPAEA